MKTEIKIYVANLSAYNNGQLIGGWFTLPTPLEEIFKVVFSPNELDENGQPYGDFTIHDYQAPFEIQEYENLKKLNEIAEMFEGLSEEQVDIIVELKKQGIITCLLDGYEALDNIRHYRNCQGMSDVAYQVVHERYNFGTTDIPDVFLTHFNYDSYGDELETSGTYIQMNDYVVEYLN